MQSHKRNGQKQWQIREISQSPINPQKRSRWWIKWYSQQKDCQPRECLVMEIKRGIKGMHFLRN
jgi:hypothetical protein